MTKETVGKKSSELLFKAQEQDLGHSADDQMQEQLRDYERNVQLAMGEGKKKYHGVFYVVVLTKKERLMQNVIRNYFFSRQTCPTPEWDQAVYRYDPQAKDVEFLWVIPARDVCQQLKDNALNIDKEERQLLEFVMAFDDGRLLDIAKKLNGEKKDSPILETA